MKISNIFLLLTVVLITFSANISAQEQRPLGIDPEWDGITNPWPELKEIPEKFTFAIIADSQVSHADPGNSDLALNANYALSTTIEEINKDPRDIKFIIHLGDIVNVPDNKSLDNWEERISPYTKGRHIINHGNHDTSPPYTLFRDYQEQVNGIRSVYYSFDVGKWHFVSLPANIEFGNYDRLEVVKPMMEWFRKDLAANKDKPTIVLVHIHFMPMGLSQLEWYTHSAELKHDLLEAMSEHGNVKWFFNGHVHNGIKVSEKTAWRYKGINFVTIPSGTSPRPFGEEYPEYEKGLNAGGYYSIVEVDGEDITLKARLVDVDKEFVYPDTFQEFTHDIEPRLFSPIVNLPAKPQLENGSFEDCLKSWYTPYRYNCDEETGYHNEWRMKWKTDGLYSGYVYTIPMGKNWLQDEYNEFYQIIESPGDNPILKGSYRIEEEPELGGGYYSLMAIGGPEDDGELKFFMQFDWGREIAKYYSDYYPRAVGYHTTGSVSSWLHLQQLGRKKQGLYFNLPRQAKTWHQITANVAELYDDAIGKPGAYAKLGVNRFVLSCGTWSVKDVELGSGAYFDGISFKDGSKNMPSEIDGEPLKTDETTFQTVFGQWLDDTVNKRPVRPIE
ncbi:cyclic 3',5'-adenosine monophosphate phosphodiesterase [Limihaloglobus sulfuriphilus]|uniref:Cyclic 3',5'-adenosine monophosphate phosphodiesterase n=1 Tax=Limihaloglobus sulfuriphilus TaxID=1851148 RepID=A0A1Q2MIM0_9BACT|nr:metallophosphoesterase [Limihaloglobus sulfuriphilus]AQQ72147.1 cyclic 3',5'-adenosine monophosphate phosphodiesterase [Limihaloglobus sulfuriphilus]